MPINALHALVAIYIYTWLQTF